MMKYDLGKLKLVYDDDFSFFFPYLALFNYAAESLNDEMSKAFSKGNTVDPVYLDQNIDGLSESIVSSIAPEAVAILIENGIYDYDEERFSSEFASEFSIRNSPEYKAFYAELEKYYMAEIKAQNDKQQRSDNNGGYWQGGGFGIGGAIKGAATAGMLNLATEAFVGIGNSMLNSWDKRALRNQKEELSKSDLTQYACYSISSLFSKKLPECLFSIMEARLHKDASVALGRNESKVKPIFNNLSKVKDDIKPTLLKQILEAAPSNEEYLLYLLNNIESLGLNKQATLSYISDMNPIAYERYVYGTFNELVKSVDSALFGFSKDFSKLKDSGDFDKLYNMVLENAVDFSVIEKNQDVFEIAVADKKLGILKEDNDVTELQASTLYLLADLELIKKCIDEGISNYTLPYQDSGKISEMADFINGLFQKYSLDKEGIAELKDYEVVLATYAISDLVTARSVIEAVQKEEFQRNGFNSEKWAGRLEQVKFKAKELKFDNIVCYDDPDFGKELQRIDFWFSDFIQSNELPFAIINSIDTVCITNNRTGVKTKGSTSFRSCQNSAITSISVDESKENVININHKEADGYIYRNKVECRKEDVAPVRELLSICLNRPIIDEENENRELQEHSNNISQISKSRISAGEKYRLLKEDAVSYGVVDENMNLIPVTNSSDRWRLQYIYGHIPTLLGYALLDRYGDEKKITSCSSPEEIIKREKEVREMYRKLNAVKLEEFGWVLNEQAYEFSKAKDNTWRKSLCEIWDDLQIKRFAALPEYTKTKKEDDRIFCTSCGQKILRTTKFCIFCGAKNTYVSKSVPEESYTYTNEITPEKVELVFQSVFSDSTKYGKELYICGKDEISDAINDNLCRYVDDVEKPLMIYNFDRYLLRGFVLTNRRFISCYSLFKMEFDRFDLADINSVTSGRSGLSKVLYLDGEKEPYINISEIKNTDLFVSNLDRFFKLLHTKYNS